MRRRPRRAYRIFFATDIHGSNRCFRKFLAAAPAYGADALILGGDLAGKAVVPVLPATKGRFGFELHGARYELCPDEMDAARELINFCGCYPVVCDEATAARIAADEDYRCSVFEELIAEQLESWCQLARTRLDAETRFVITPGNDDPLWLETVLATHAPRVECPEGAVVKLGPVWLASLAYVNRTPWKTPRERDEDELTRQIEALLASCDRDSSLVFNFHAPPRGSGLDTAAQLTADLKPIIRHGAVATAPVGSRAVRDAIETYRPTVGLHGHIHESRGAARIGRTVCLNPGSDYDTGVLRGAIVDFSADGGYCEHLLTAG